MEKNELNKDIYEIENILLKELDLKNNLSIEELANFYEHFIPFLKHNRNEELKGRTAHTTEKYIKNYINFCNYIGLTKRETISIIEKFPSIIRICDGKFFKLYSFLGLLEDETNSIRKERFLNKPEDFMVSLELIYARYKLMTSLKYEPITWSNLVHSSEKDFGKKFVVSKYKKPYRRFESIDEVTSDKLRKMYPVDDNIISRLVEIELEKNGEKVNEDRKLK